jgi:hypothetical protein
VILHNTPIVILDSNKHNFVIKNICSCLLLPTRGPYDSIKNYSSFNLNCKPKKTKKQHITKISVTIATSVTKEEAN